MSQSKRKSFKQYPEYKKTWYQANKARLQAKGRIYYLKNHQVIDEQNKQHYLLNKEEIKLYKKQWAFDNKQKLKKMDKDLGWSKSWKQRNRGKLNSQKAKYMADKLTRTPNWLTSQQLKQIETFYLEAQYCTNLTEFTWSVDHIVPLRGEIVSGLHVPWNLDVIPLSINNIKNNKF